MSSPLTIMNTGPYFTGTISDTPSGRGYNVAPGQVVSVDSVDVALLLTFGFTIAAVANQSTVVVEDGATTVANVGTINFSSGATITAGASGTANVAIDGGSGSSLTVEDDAGDTISSVATLTFAGVNISGSSPSAIVNMTTVTGSAGVGNATGASVHHVGGAGGTGPNYGFGGSVVAYGGAGSATPTTFSTGGSVKHTGGYGGAGTNSAAGGDIRFNGGGGGKTTDTQGDGGGVIFVGGAGYERGSGGGVNFAAGSAYGAGAAGTLRFSGGSAYGVGTPGEVVVYCGNSYGGQNGGNFNIITGRGAVRGAFGVNHDTSLLVLPPFSWQAGEQLNGRTIVTTTRPVKITAVIGRVDVASGGVATLVVVKAPSGTAPASGVPLTSNSMDLNGTANANQTLTLSSTVADLILAAGDSLCLATSGSPAASAGCITLWGTPQ